MGGRIGTVCGGYRFRLAVTATNGGQPFCTATIFERRAAADIRIRARTCMLARKFAVCKPGSPQRDTREMAGGKMRIFVASLSTETNTFTPMPTTRNDFRIYNPGPGSEGKNKPHPAYTILHRRAPKDGIVVLEGLGASAPPSGTVRQDTYEEFRDEILQQVTAAMPLDGVVLGLHGVRHIRQSLSCDCPFAAARALLTVAHRYGRRWWPMVTMTWRVTSCPRSERS